MRGIEQQKLSSDGEASPLEGSVKGYSRTFKAGLLASGHFLTSCVSLVSMMVLARVLTMRDYATYKQTMLAYAFAAPLLTLGLPQALYYFLPGERERARAVLLENLLLLGGMGAVFSLFLLLGGNKLLALRFNNPDLAKTLLILAPYPLFMLPASALGACLMARDRVKQLAIFNVLSRLLMLAAVVAACLIWRTPTAALIGTVAGAGIVLFPAMKLMLGSCKDGKRKPTAWGMRSQLNYSVPLGLATMIATISLGLDKVLVSSLCNPEAFAVYVNGAIEIPLIGVLTGSVTAVLIPDFTRLYRVGEYEQILALWHRAIVKCATFIYPVGIFLFVMAPEIMRLLFSARYSESALPFRIYLLLLPARITSFGAIFMASGNNRLILYRVLVGLILNFALTVGLIYWVGAFGAAIGTVVVMYFWSIPQCLFYICRILAVGYRAVFPWRMLLRLGLISGCASAVFTARFWISCADLTATIVFGALFGLAILGLYALYGILSARAALNAVKQVLKL